MNIVRNIVREAAGNSRRSKSKPLDDTLNLELVFQPNAIGLVYISRTQRVDVGNIDLLTGYRMLVNFRADSAVTVQVVVHPDDPKPPEFTGERAQPHPALLEGGV